MDKPIEIRCNFCHNAGVSVKFRGKFYCSDCFNFLYDQENNEIKTIPNFSWPKFVGKRNRSHRKWRERYTEKKKKLIDLKPEELEF